MDRFEKSNYHVMIEGTEKYVTVEQFLVIQEAANFLEKNGVKTVITNFKVDGGVKVDLIKMKSK